MSLPVICFAGMTHLGIVSAAAAASKGFKVYGFDPDSERIRSLSDGVVPFLEPDLKELLGSSREMLSFTENAKVVESSDLVMISVDIPTNEYGDGDLSAIQAILAEVQPWMAKQSTLVVLSQVPPGFTRLSAGGDKHTYYQVETLVFGRAVEHALNPERIIVGCKVPGQELPEHYSAFVDAFDCPVLRMGYESAELAKIAINCMLAASITTANTLAEICESVGANWRDIAPALKMDPRIGPSAYLTPGLGIGGGNLERDLETVAQLADLHGADSGVVRAFQSNSAHRRDWLLRVLHSEVFSMVPEPRVALLGLTYKAGTSSTKNSPGAAILNDLVDIRVQMFDPVVQISPSESNLHRLETNLFSCCAGVDVVVICTAWPEFACMDLGIIAQGMRGDVIIDTTGLIDIASCETAGLRCIAIGRGRSIGPTGGVAR